MMKIWRGQVWLVTVLLAGLVLCLPVAAKTDPAVNEAGKLLPDQIGTYKSAGPATTATQEPLASAPDTIGPSSTATREYRSEQELTVSVILVHTETDSAAYSLLTQLAPNTESIKTGHVGIASIGDSNKLVFCKGVNLVEVSAGANSVTADQLVSFAREIAATLPEGDNDIPVLIRHLPSGESSAHAQYAVTLTGLKKVSPNQPVLDTIDFAGGTEAVAANYGQSQLVIVEFTTPQLSIDNDQRIWTRIGELKAQGQSVPTAYRRVGNYSVFVFNAPSDKTANELIDQVKYEQVVQWLGDDPHLADKVERYLVQTSANVVITVLESSGLSLLVCLSVGALFGTLLFRYRRAQHATRYSDAGGSVRLNLDELTGNSDSRRLLNR
jgi:hypothetical protein